MKRLLPLALLLAGACAHNSMSRGFYGEDTRTARENCRTGELGWWGGSLSKCAWYPFKNKRYETLRSYQTGHADDYGGSPPEDSEQPETRTQ
jgi:hypothetical protein